MLNVSMTLRNFNLCSPTIADIRISGVGPVTVSRRLVKGVQAYPAQARERSGNRERHRMRCASVESRSKAMRTMWQESVVTPRMVTRWCGVRRLYE